METLPESVIINILGIAQSLSLPFVSKEIYQKCKCVFPLLFDSFTFAAGQGQGSVFSPDCVNFHLRYWKIDPLNLAVIFKNAVKFGQLDVLWVLEPHLRAHPFQDKSWNGYGRLLAIKYNQYKVWRAVPIDHISWIEFDVLKFIYRGLELNSNYPLNFIKEIIEFFPGSREEMLLSSIANNQTDIIKELISVYNTKIKSRHDYIWIVAEMNVETFRLLCNLGATFDDEVLLWTILRRDKLELLNEYLRLLQPDEETLIVNLGRARKVVKLNACMRRMIEHLYQNTNINA